MSIPGWIWWVGGAVLVGGAAALAGGGEGEAEGEGEPGPKVRHTKPTTKGTQPPKGKVQRWTPPDSKGEVEVVYDERNSENNVGGVVPLEQKDVPEVRIPDTGSRIGSAITGVASELVRLVGIWTGGKLYPTKWTETQGQLYDVTAASIPDGAKILVRVQLYAAWRWPNGSVSWYQCRRLTFRADDVKVSTVLRDPEIYEGGQTTDKGRIACMYSRRKYAAAGLPLDITPLPEAPGDVELHIGFRDDAGVRRMGLYLWLPPRLGMHKAVVSWTVWGTE